ncbi:hypothetical protein [Cyanothece sp. BG0011]|uniref:hypothetical protein n=1 Tax=Cyanothece sp. BG0011 TaxID=2082950 RepID=UPI000D1D764C|nr:hypothetical protein [Cyanothece sp. BG0011]
MSKKKYVILTTVAVIGSWFARGVYDDLKFYNGYCHVINGTEEDKIIELTFPSGESTKANIQPRNLTTFAVSNTGEGSIAVKSDGQEIGNVGYVTSFNPPIIIVVMDNKIVFQYLPRP